MQSAATLNRGLTTCLLSSISNTPGDGSNSRCSLADQLERSILECSLTVKGVMWLVEEQWPDEMSTCQGVAWVAVRLSQWVA